MKVQTELTIERMIAMEPNTGCWLWTGAENEKGYPRSHGKGVHRIMYDRFVGTIPKGMEIDHTCRVRSCVNPRHLEPVTHRENVLRGISFIAERAFASHCKRGHALKDDNLVPRANGRRECRICWRMHARNVYARKKENAHA
jgi:hypothetical protein